MIIMIMIMGAKRRRKDRVAAAAALPILDLMIWHSNYYNYSMSN